MDPTDRDLILSEVAEMLGCDIEIARHYLEMFHYDQELAIAEFFNRYRSNIMIGLFFTESNHFLS
jgi:hypothetical protein